MKKLITWLIVSCFLTSIAIADQQKIQTPENAKLAWISQNLNQDGMLLDIQTFRSDESVENVLSFYREVWFKEGEIPGFVENKLGEWAIISQLRDESNIVLQVKPREDGTTEGFLSKAIKNSGVGQPKLDFPMPDGTERFSSSYIEEDETEVHTMTFLSTQSVGNAANFYRSSMARKGWRLAKEDEVDGNQIMLFNRNGDRCELVVSQLDSESTVIHVNRVKRNG